MPKFREVVRLSSLNPGDRFATISRQNVALEVKRKHGDVVFYGTPADRFGKKMHHDMNVIFLRSTGPDKYTY